MFSGWRAQGEIHMGFCTSKINPSCDSPLADSSLENPSKRHFGVHPLPSTQRKCSELVQPLKRGREDGWKWEGEGGSTGESSRRRARSRKH
eukprot:9482516-Pyramimonas_sp.AAC.1